MSANIRSTVRPYADRIGAGGLLRKSWTEVTLLGERLQRLGRWQPGPNETILLAGSGRSGTTWLADLLTTGTRVQPIFEPLLPRLNEGVRKLTGWNRTDGIVRSFYLRPEGEYPEWHSLLKLIFTARYRSYWTDHERKAWFPKAYLIKEIRGNLMLGYIYRHFQPKIVYVVRHPCAVIASRLRVNWPADVSDILSQEELVEDHLVQWIGEIEKEQDSLGAHAVWWMVENLVASRQLATVPHCKMLFEDLRGRPSETFPALFDYIGADYSPERIMAVADNPSRMTSKSVGHDSADSYINSWKRFLDTESQKRILKWADRAGMQELDAG